MVGVVEQGWHQSVGLLEAAPDAIVGVASDGRIALVNAQTERLFGYTRDELIGQPVEILVPDAVRAVHPDHRGRYFADPQPRPMGAGMELAGRRSDGTEFPAEISLSALETEEGLLVSAAVRDVMLGKEVAERLQGIRPGIRTLYMSGYAHPVLTSQGTLDPGVTLIEKPFTEPDLLAKANAVLGEPEQTH